MKTADQPKKAAGPVLAWSAGPRPETLALPEIPHLRLRVTLEARQKAELPPYKGSLLRGAFGHALRRAVCAAGRGQDCDDCSLHEGCAYGRLFEPRQGFVAGRPSAVRPYVFEPHGFAERYGPGDLLKFDLLLFGDAVELQAFAVLACERLAEAGLGYRRARFELQRVAFEDRRGAWRSGFERGVRRWGEKAPAAPLPGEPLPGDRLTLRLLTPVRIKGDGRLIRHFDFRLLASRMLRRTLELAHLAGGGAEAAGDFDVEAFLERAEGVRVDDARTRWFDWRRFSNRQGSTMKLGGVVGEIDLEGDLEPFSALLRTAEVVHVGKGATFGLGKVAVK